MSSPFDYLKLARPKQWAKSAFVLIGPIYGLGGGGGAGRASAVSGREWAIQALVAALAFALASSACYVANDVLDAPRDRLHPRKAKRPVAAGRVSVASAMVFAGLLLSLAGGVCLFPSTPHRDVFSLILGLYVANTLGYSIWFKHVPVLDVMSLAMGFVLRVLGGCAAVGIEPSSWLLNCTLFLSMFLALGKRLGERRTAASSGLAADGNRPVQRSYSAELLRMMVVVSAVATLITYAGYVQDRTGATPLGTPFGVPVLWLTMLPATFALLRCLLLLEQGEYDDPTELAYSDLSTVMAAGVFAGLTLWAVVRDAGVITLH
jgi:decaprenyl-phosphate phosphoribosyltransferase